ncbi:MAG: ribosome small subunit-dependent GTPase A [Candidatus Marivariicella sp.]
MILGTVYRSTGSWYKVVTQNEIINCRIQGRLRLNNIKSTNPVVVGDKVLIQKDQLSKKNEGLIVEIKERKNYIIRKSVNLSKQSHIIGANVDQAFLLITLKNPTTTMSFIDRFLITAEAYKVKCILVFNKIDCYDKSLKIKMNEMINLYSKIGYSCIKISASKKINIKKIKDLIIDKICMFSGHSGVGKSTLINCLSKNLKIPTTPISKYHQQGQHTTTFAEMYDIDNGAKLIDTPGIKGFGLVNMNKDEISNYFTEFNKFSPKCRFKNCLHINEPSCAVKKAVNDNEISSSRYSNYIKLLEDHKIYRD